MPRERKPWFRVYVETISDQKVRKLHAAERWLWIAILSASRESIEPGRLLIHTDLPMDERDLARYADMDPRAVRKALPKMLQLGMIAMDGSIITIPNWAARQYESDDVNARSQRFRERQKQQQSNVHSNVATPLQKGTLQRCSVTPDTDTDKEEPPSLRSGGAGGAQEARKRRQGERLPDGWRPDPTIHSEMRVKFPHVNTELETEKFKDYWHAKAGKDATKLDWQATWRNWIRNAAERTTNQPNNQLKSRRQLERDAMFERQLARAKERDAANEPRTNSETSTSHRSLLPSTES